MLTSGIELGKTYVIGATKKSGKSKIVISIIKSLVEAKVKPAFLSLEMGGESVVKELISAFADINNNLLKMPLDIDVENKIREVTEKFENVEIDTQSYLNIMQIRHKVRQASQRGVKVIFIDYLQRMNFEKRSNSNDAKIIADTCSQIADIAKEFNVAIIYLSQLRNNADNEMADISMLKDSGGIAEAVDCILIINNIDRIEKNYDEYSKKNEAHIMVEQRSGVSGVVICDIDLSRAKFSEKEKRF
jgi:replicative DNA helicase